MRPPWRVPLGLLLLGLTATAPAGGQAVDGWDPERLHASRGELEELRDRYQRAAASRAYSDGLQVEARLEADRLSARLGRGDFTVGDRILVHVEGLEQLSDTFTVRPGGKLTLPLVGDVSLTGVLRSEIEGHLAERIAGVVLDAVVRVQPLVPVAVLGSVVRPGYYSVPADAPISEILMLAGGPTPGADLERMTVERGSVEVRSGDEVQEAIARGLTIDQVGVRAGDRLSVPSTEGLSVADVGRTALLSLPGLLLAVLSRF